MKAPLDPPRSRVNGIALVITMAFLVLMTALVLVFFSRVTDSSNASVVASSQTEVNLLAKSALQVVFGDLRTEMLSGSSVQSAQNYLWMKPANDAAWNPYRQVSNGVSSDTNFQNLIKQSVSNVPFYPAAAPYDPSRPTLLGASAVSTSAPSVDRHVFTPARWDLPALATGSFTAAQVPDWVYVARSGIPQPQTYAAGWKDQKSSSAILGRFAYNVYDISGLLDINVAGFPPSSAARAMDKGGLTWSVLDSPVTIAGADSKLVDPIDSFLGWRNGTSRSDYENFVTVYGQQKGFLTHNYGDRQFDTRSDLIRYASRTGSPIAARTLPYLTTFSRTVNAPVWTPTTPPGSSVDYAAQADQATANNRAVAGVRVLAGFTRRDGTSALVGEPLLKTRFPLSKLALLPAGSTGDIKTYFGLSRDQASAAWTPDLLAGKIRTLDQVAKENREPNFFELLKAGILTGALGGNDSGQSLLTNYESDLSVDRQVLQIGANIIDQYDDDSIPTWISTVGLASDGGTTGDVFGVENHPFISAMFQLPVRRHDRGNENSDNPRDPLNPYPYVNVFLQFQIWNPHVNASTAPGGLYRIIATAGRSHVSLVPAGGTPPAKENLTDSAVYFKAGSGGLTVSEPLLLNADRVATQTSSQNIYAVGGAKVAGLYLGQVDASHNRDKDGNNSNDHSYLSAPLDSAARVQVQWQAPSGSWVRVQELGPLSNAVASGTAYNGTASFDQAEVYTNAIKVDTNYLFSDPRTLRYGVHGKSTPANSPMQGDQSLRFTGSSPAYGKTAFASFNLSPYFTITGVPQPYGPEYAPAELAENDTSSATYVKGTDKVPRLADATKAQNVYASGSQGRPFVLNRAFRSVGEMAFAYRDEPWKTLDFFTAKSGDAALLDLFSVNEAPIQAGVINLNRADAGVMQAMLAGSLGDPALPSSGALDARAVANALRQALGPVNNQTILMTNRADLPKVLAAASLSSLDKKRQREVVARTFGDQMNCRTWNLLVDLVVQSGKIGPAGSAPGDFSMMAERRMWAQVAIDRVSGEVIDVQTETINE